MSGNSILITIYLYPSSINLPRLLKVPSLEYKTKCPLFNFF